MQHQAGEAEKRIKAEYERIREALDAEEKQRLQALATEEQEKTAAIAEMIKDTEKDIVALNKHIETLKKEMGNEDLPLVRVREGSLVLSVLFSCFT